MQLAAGAGDPQGSLIMDTQQLEQLRSHGVTREAIQSAVRIAAVVHVVAGVLEYHQPPAATGT